MSNVYRSNKKSGGITPTGTKQITINAAGTTTHDVAAYANAEVTTSGLVKPTGTKTITENGTGIDVANYEFVDVNVSGGGSLKETLLWENPTPSSTYGENTITLSDSVQNYDYLRFEFTRGTTNPEIFSVIYTVDELDNTAANQNGEKLSSPTIYIAGTGYYTRVLSKVSDTSIIFANCKRYNDSGTTNSPTSIMPYKVFGLKLGGEDMPNLDYANPLFVSTTGNLTYTATQDCYVVSQFAGSGSTITTLTINNEVVVGCPDASAFAFGSAPIFKISAGDVVSINRVDGNKTFFKVFKEKSN